MKKNAAAVFGVALIMLIIGIVLIAATKEGFSTLKDLGVGGVLRVGAIERAVLVLAGINVEMLQAGVVFAVILTPIFVAISIILFILGLTSDKK